MNQILYRSIEIVGADVGNDERSCGLHIENCGAVVQIGSKAQTNQNCALF
jgi:hypothetical protein